MAQADPTLRVVLTRKQVKKYCESDLKSTVKDFLTRHCRQHYTNNEATLTLELLDRDIESIYDKDDIPEDIPLDDTMRKRLNDLIDDEIRETDQDMKEALASKLLEPFQYFAKTMNMNGPTAQGFTADRRTMINTILGNVVPGVVFCQELPGFFEQDIVKKLNVKSRRWDYTKLTKAHAGIMWSTQHFTRKPLPDDTMLRIRDGLCGQGQPAHNLLSRASFVKLTGHPLDVEPPRSFIACSYHGKNTGNHQERMEIFHSLIQFLSELCQEEGNIPFLIGGDFNFDTTKIDLPNISLPVYEMTRRSSVPGKICYKDNFIWKLHVTTPIDMTHVRPFVLKEGEDCDLSVDERDDVDNLPAAAASTQVNVDDLLDHDPIIGVLVLGNPTGDVNA